VRRRIGRWERSILYAKAKGKCVICGCKLKDGWHADHIEPFVKTGRTSVWEMQALCPPCNLRKGARPMEPINKHGDISMTESIDLSGFREAQARLFMAVSQAVIEGNKEIGVHLHIRGGKTMLMRMLAKHLVDKGEVSVALIVNNRSELRRQCADTAAFEEDCRRVGLSGGREWPASSLVKTRNVNGKSVECVGHFPDDPWGNNEYILSSTIQTLSSRNNERAVSTWIESVTYQTKKPVLVFIDEAQEFGTDEAEGSEGWERFVDLVRAMGCVLVSLSGFPHREDGKSIPGFKKINAERSQSTVNTLGDKIREEDDGTSIYELQTRDVDTEEFELEPMGGSGFVFPLSYGFDTSALCSIYEKHISRQVTLMEDGKEVVTGKAISELSKHDAQRHLRAYLHHESVVMDAVKSVNTALMEKRQADPNIKAMIFTCSDDAGEGGNDNHANQVAECIRKNTNLSCIIVTQKSVAEYGGSTSDALMSFKTDAHDIIILKNVGRVGFDCPRAKVLCDLSDVRAQGKTVQTWLRISTPYNDISGVIIHPNDPRAKDHYQAAIGKHMDRLRYSSSKIVNTGETEVNFKNRDLTVGDLVDSMTSDNAGRQITSEQSRLVSAYKRKFPTQVKYMERLTEQAQWFDFVEPYLNTGAKLIVESKPEVSAKNPKLEIQDIRSKIYGTKNPRKIGLVDQFMSSYYGGLNYKECLENNISKTEWQSVRATAQRQAKAFGGEWKAGGIDQLISLRARPVLDPDRVNASTAPRRSNAPGSPEWCYQTANLLKDAWNGLDYDRDRVEKYLVEIRSHKAWLKIPVANPYGDEKTMLKEELGITEPIEKVIGRRVTKQQEIQRRREKVRVLADQGHTQQQIAEAMGVSQPTVADDIKALSEKSGIPQKADKPRQRKTYQIQSGTKPETAAQRIRETFGDDFAIQLGTLLVSQ